MPNIRSRLMYTFWYPDFITFIIIDPTIIEYYSILILLFLLNNRKHSSNTCQILAILVYKDINDRSIFTLTQNINRSWVSVRLFLTYCIPQVTEVTYCIFVSILIFITKICTHHISFTLVVKK